MEHSHKLAPRKSGALAVFNRIGRRKQVTMWKIKEGSNHQQTQPRSPQPFFVRGYLIWFDVVGNTLLGVDEREIAISWCLQKEEYIGQIKLVRRKDDGPFDRAILWPSRGSMFFVTDVRSCKSIHEWTIGTPYLDSWY